jgi:biopolymer transport protein ExbD
MQFTQRRRRQPPSVIIVSLIDVLMVVLIFLMVTTAFKNQPSVKIVLPESKQGAEGASEGHLLVTIGPQAPYFYLGARQVTLDELRSELQTAVRRNPRASVSINSDGKAPVQEFIRVLDVVHQVNIPAQVLTRHAGNP